MLLSAQAARHAHRLLAARAESSLIPTLSSQGPLSMEDGYDVAKNIMDIRIAQGEVMVVVCPSHAETIAHDGWSKQHFKEFLYEKARKPG